MRNHIRPSATTPVMQFGALEIDRDGRTLSVGGQPCELTSYQFDLLLVLAERAGRVLTRGQLIDRVWGSDYFGDTKTLDVHIKRIRSKIEDDPSRPKHLVTVRGLGYKFEA